jgi:hypothetical protein
MRDFNTHLRAIANQDGAAILDTKRGTISTLNTTGAFIWEALVRGETIEAITDSLARQTGENLAVVRRDVRVFIDELKEQHMLPL